MKNYQYNFLNEIIVDNFAGGGGASTGIELATGRIVDIAINHDKDAIAMHERNHPLTRHFCEDVWQIDPVEAVGGRAVALAWFSPDCKHFSKAKGGKPVEKKIRGLAWVAVRWASTVKPRVIILENVEEFMTWCPIKDGKPIKEKQGQTFNSFVNALKAQGYDVDWRVLRACDYGAPTIRKRFFLIARCDGEPIVFPKPTHGKGLIPYRTAGECIDWDIPTKTIFNRAKPLAENTLCRIARGLDKFVIKEPQPYIMVNNIHNVPKGVDEPLPTITTGNHLFLVQPYLSQYHTEKSPREVRGQKIDSPLLTIDGAGRYALAACYLTKYFSGESQSGATLSEPAPTVTAIDHSALVEAHLCILRKNEDCKPFNEPFNTLTTSAGHFAKIDTHLCKCDGTKSVYNWGNVRELLNEYCSYDIKEDEILIFVIGGVEYFIADIGIRMLMPRELANAQGFPPDYVLEVNDSYSKAAQIARIGNSVCPAMATALVRANLTELCPSKPLTTMEQLSTVLSA